MLKFKLKFVFQQIVHTKYRKMGSCECFEGKILIKEDVCNLDLTLLGGQSFRWEKVEQQNGPEWRGVAYDAYWILKQNPQSVTYKVYPVLEERDNKKSYVMQKNATSKEEHFENLLKRYLRLDFDLHANVAKWKAAHKHFAKIASNMKAVRVLDQEPLENILSFICSQNNHIKRISTMIRWLCCEYGCKVGTFDGQTEYTFPTLLALQAQQHQLEQRLREAKFGYRAKFIAQTVAKIFDAGGDEWFKKLRQLPYAEARLELVTLPGIGFKVADCICLMSLGHLEAVPIDTHIYKIAQTEYLPNLAKVKSVTPKIYEDISQHFRSIYGPYAGWTQAVLFCSELQQFNANKTECSSKNSSKTALKKKLCNIE